MLSMETSVEQTINPFIHLRRNSESDSMPEDTHIGINKRRSCMHFHVCICMLHYSKLLYRLTDSPLSTTEKI